MFSTFPSTPGRGRSRFSKALPIAPGDASTSPTSSPALISKYMHSPLPPLPKEKKMATIPRRPVGRGGMESSKAPSVKSMSSVYSDSPGLSHSFSDTSTKDSLSGVDSDAVAAEPTPPLPPKDSQRRPNLPSSPNKLLDKPLPNFNPSPPRTELWKRRSTSSSKSIHFADLKLQKSNGSTASPPKNQDKSTDRGPPRSVAGRKPVPARPAPPQPDLMGNKISKLRSKAPGEQEDGSENSPRSEAPQQSYTPYRRLPTPEYLKADKQRSPVSKVLSPTSPFTPPEDKPPALPPKSDYRAENVRPDAARSDSLSTTIRPVIFPSSHSREISDTRTITSDTLTVLAPHPTKPFGGRLLTPQFSPDKASPLVLPSPNHVIHFPTVKAPAEAGTIFPGLPLDVVHFDCYQSHRFMRSTKNTLCPTGCMMCQQADTENRWRCTWCCLSACSSCMQVLRSTPGKDLKSSLERVRK